MAETECSVGVRSNRLCRHKLLPINWNLWERPPGPASGKQTSEYRVIGQSYLGCPTKSRKPSRLGPKNRQGSYHLASSEGRGCALRSRVCKCKVQRIGLHIRIISKNGLHLAEL